MLFGGNSASADLFDRADGVGDGYDITSGFTTWSNEAGTAVLSLLDVADTEIILAGYNWADPGYTEGTGHFTQVIIFRLIVPQPGLRVLIRSYGRLHSR